MDSQYSFRIAFLLGRERRVVVVVGGLVVVVAVVWGFVVVVVVAIVVIVVVVAVNNICYGCKQKDVEKESFPLHGVVDVVTVLKKKQGNNISKNCLTHFLYSGKIVFTVYAKTCTVLIT